MKARGALLIATAGLVVLGVGAADDAAAPLVVNVWPGEAPGGNEGIGEEQAKTNEAGVVTSVTNVTRPTLTVHRPEKAKDTGTAIVVCPGGGYNVLAWDHEGEQVARWLNSIGVTAAILKYRVPRRPGHPRDQPPPQALMDAQRALSLVRSKASEWGIDPKRIGILGFSAGGHLTMWASTNFDARKYEPIDAIDKADCRPDFAIAIYSGGAVKSGTDTLAPEIRVTSETPPTFLAHAGDDRVNPENSVLYYLALKRAGVPAELHIYSKGGHGFGMRPSDNPVSTWPRRAEEWLKTLGVLEKAS